MKIVTLTLFKILFIVKIMGQRDKARPIYLVLKLLTDQHRLEIILKNP